MKTFQKIFMISLILMGMLTVVSCSSDDDDNIADDGLNLEGNWQFDTMDFLDDSVEWDPEIEYTSANTFGYAPYMFEYAGVKGFIFGTEAVEGLTGEIVGKRFDYVLTGEFGQDPDEAYWYWNYEEEGESFSMAQVNPSFPPHDYSINEITEVEISESGNKLEFKGTLKTREVGGSMSDMYQVPVAFSLTKGEPTENVEILIQGEPFTAPE